MTKRSQRRKVELYGYSSDGRTSASLAAPANTTLPTQTGLGKVGNVQTCNPGVWTGGYASTSYQWKINATAVPGATAAAYTPVAADATKTLTCTVTGTNPKGSASATTTGVVVAP